MSKLAIYSIFAGLALPTASPVRTNYDPNPRTSLGKWSRTNHDGRRAGASWPGDGVKPAETRQMRRHP